ncbi:MAG: FliM/FliN family flagellar motor switch protein [Clostridiales Family XIII bacterium]|jgi:flagellar motor switch protein FliM|nr:FliM/FliN family flagellar motor switch protein [Clostridiales Family XIII bacterium]
MADILSQSQIDSLLSSLINKDESVNVEADDNSAEVSGKNAQSDKKVKEYDFRSPKLFTREQLKLLFGIYENYARIVSSQITGTLQTYTLVELLEVEEQKYYEFNNALPDSVLLSIIDFPVLGEDDEENFMFLDVAKDIGFCTVDKLLGGVGRPLEEDRDYTEIEMTILEHFMRTIVALMRNVWFDYIEVSPRLTKLETNSRILQGISPDDNVVIVAMSITVNETQGRMNICIPASTLEMIFKMRAAQSKKNARKENLEMEGQRRRNIMGNIYDTDLEMRGILGTVMVPAKDIIQLEIGDVIQLDKMEDSLVELTVEESIWFRGEMGVHNKKLAIAIKECLKGGKDS